MAFAIDLTLIDQPLTNRGPSAFGNFYLLGENGPFGGPGFYHLHGRQYWHSQ